MIKKNIAIIGGGFSGIAVAYNLLQLNKEIKIDIFDDEHFKNNGKAYATHDLSHILNVPADKMGLPYDDEKHFYHWLKNISDISGDSFVCRDSYRIYLQEIILELKKNSNINFVNDKISAIRFVDGKYILSSQDKLFGQHDNVVLACGLTIKKLSQNLQSEKIIENIWQFFNQENLPELQTILIIGAGLTMVDAALSLKNKGFKGRIIACSGKGKLPLPHPKERVQIVPSLEISDANLPLSQILKKLRNITKNHPSWQSVIHSLRPITTAMWQKFDLPKKQQFLRHLMGFWSIHRHRIARQNNDQILEMISSGKLQIMKGRLKNLEEKNNKIFATLNSGKIIETDLVLNATGFDFAGKESDLVQNLLQEKIIINHQTKLGFSVIKNHPNFYLAGGLLTGELLEITAVPDLRILAHQIAVQINNNLMPSCNLV